MHSRLVLNQRWTIPLAASGIFDSSSDEANASSLQRTSDELNCGLRWHGVDVLFYPRSPAEMCMLIVPCWVPRVAGTILGIFGISQTLEPPLDFYSIVFLL